MSNTSIMSCHVCLEKILDGVLLDVCCHTVCRCHVVEVKRTKCQEILGNSRKCQSPCNMDEWRIKRVPSVPSEFVSNQQTSSKQAATSEVCQECQQEAEEGDEVSEATCRCLDCSNLLCEARKTKSHQIESLEEVTVSQIEGKCPKEDLKAISSY